MVLKLERERPQLSWEDFKFQCNLRFGPPIRSNKLGELSKLRQTSTVKDYQWRFEKPAARASTLTQEQDISGLKKAIAIEVELQHPTDLTNAMTLARLYEHQGNRHQGEPSRLLRSTTNDASRTPFVKRLSRTKMEERRGKGLCYNCDKH